MSVQAQVEKIGRGTFVGGPRKDFERIGREQLIALLQNGLTPQSNVLDIGCGALRGGYWMVKFLERGRYCGIEPNEQMLNEGISKILPREDYVDKKPEFSTNDNFDFSVFGRKFDFFMARSIWTHAPKSQIRLMLDAFGEHGADDAVFLTSFLPARWWRGDDYAGEKWVGKSHQSKTAGMVRHSWRWIKKECRSRGMVASREKTAPWVKPWIQHWIVIKKDARVNAEDGHDG